MEQPNFILLVNFYRTDVGNEPVRDWLKELPRDDKRIIGEDNESPRSKLRGIISVI